MLNIAICDDESTDADKINKLVLAWSDSRQEEIRIRQFSSAYLLLDEVSRGSAFDIFLLDILMPDMTGISLGGQLQNHLMEPLLIYLTISEDFYPDAFRLYAFQYLCKPITQGGLSAVLDKALLRCEKRKKDMFVLKTTEGIIQISVHTIVYVELLAHVCHFHLTDGRVLQSQYLRTSFDSFINPLLQQQRFIKTHTAFVVNLEFSGKLTPTALSLTTGVTVPVTRTFTEQVQRCYMAYALQEEGEK